jgi:FAD/FMN-containing dehydrogenase
MTDIDAARLAWRRLLGDAAVLDPAQAHERFGADTGGARRQLAGALRVERADQVAEVMRIAQSFGAPVHPISTGRNWGYGTALPPRDGCHILDLSGLQAIRDFDPELGVVTVEPGVTQGMLHEFLAARRAPFLVPVTGAGPDCSLVGNALERGYGITPITDHFAAVMDAEVVLPDGRVHLSLMRRWGGAEAARLYRWGVGPYVTGLFSQGNLGVVTALTLALARRPARVASFLFSLADDTLLEGAVDRVRHILRALPGVVGGINLMNRHRVLAMTAPYPDRSQRDSRGLIPPPLLQAMGRQFQVAPWTGFVTLYGLPAVVQAARSELKSTLADIGTRCVFMTPQRAQTLARLTAYAPGAVGRRLARTTLTLAKSMQLVQGQPSETALPLAYWRSGKMPAHGKLNPARDGCGLRWFAPLVPMRPSTVRSFVRGVHSVTAGHGIEPLITLTSVNERIFDSTVPILFDPRDLEATYAAHRCHAELLEMGFRMGCVPYRLGSDDLVNRAGSDSKSRFVVDEIRDIFDPAGILSPGKYRTTF